MNKKFPEEIACIVDPANGKGGIFISNIEVAGLNADQRDPNGRRIRARDIGRVVGVCAVDQHLAIVQANAIAGGRGRVAL